MKKGKSIIFISVMGLLSYLLLDAGYSYWTDSLTVNGSAYYSVDLNVIKQATPKAEAKKTKKLEETEDLLQKAADGSFDNEDIADDKIEKKESINSEMNKLSDDKVIDNDIKKTANMSETLPESPKQEDESTNKANSQKESGKEIVTGSDTEKELEEAKSFEDTEQTEAPDSSETTNSIYIDEQGEQVVPEEATEIEEGMKEEPEETEDATEAEKYGEEAEPSDIIEPTEQPSKGETSQLPEVTSPTISE